MEKFKNIDKNIFVFIIIFAIIISGLFSMDFVNDTGETLKHFYRDLKGEDPKNAVPNMTSKFETDMSEHLTYHSQFMDISSIYNRAINTRVVKKDDSTTVVRLDNDLLSGAEHIIDKEVFNRQTDNLKKLYSVATENQADFLYVMAPKKEYYSKFPDNIKNNTKYNCDRFLAKLDDKNIPYLNLISKMKEENISTEDMFFATDHHWKPQYGIWGMNKLCEELNSRYGFEFDKKLTDINNYNIKTYKNYFLGAYGKKVGTYFTPLGTDDFDLITPKFETSLVKEVPSDNKRIEGAFAEALISMENIEQKDHYIGTVYNAYDIGTAELQIIKNKLSNNGKTVFMISDSFGQVLNPYLSLEVAELHIADMRVKQNKINAYEYIKKIKPDYVILLFTGINDSIDKDKFNFG